MNDQTLSLLRRLTRAHGVSGFEDDVRKIFRESVPGPIVADRLGSLYALRKGRAERPVVMLTAHLDEVGFLVQSITAEGLIRLVSIGGVWGHAVLAQRLRILTETRGEVVGVVASKPIHFTSEEERKRVVPVEEMLLDVGAANADEARQRFGVRVGQPVVFDSELVRLGDSDRIVAKALDNRAGVALVIAAAAELARGDHPNAAYCGATCQEELRARGAQTAARLLKPDVALVIEGVPADDGPGSSPETRQAALGQGVHVRIMDGSGMMNRKLNELIGGVAERHGIPCQWAVRRSGGTDAGAISLNELGVPSAVLGIPVRYPHTAHGMMDLRDFFHGVRLVVEVVRQLDEAACARLVEA